MQTCNRVLDGDSTPGSMKPKVWYLMSPKGYLAEPRVGHSATYLPDEKKVIFVGGANPEGLLEDIWSLDLTTLICRRIMTEGDFDNRYEHCAFVPKKVRAIGENVGNTIWVFGGANKEENKNDLCELSLKTLKWSCLAQQGVVPSCRTIRTTTACVEGKLLVFGGGGKGIESEPDTHVYQLDPHDKMWSILETRGEPPTHRHGHVLVAVKEKLYIHGGLSGEFLFDDLYILKGNGTWVEAVVSEVRPSARAGHGAATYGNYIYMFGGLSKTGVMNDFWRINIDGLIWERILLIGDPMLSARVDFAMTIVDLPDNFTGIKVKQEKESDEVNSIEDYLNMGGNSSQDKISTLEQCDETNSTWSPFILIHGGMDERANAYNDFHAYRLETN